MGAMLTGDEMRQRASARAGAVVVACLVAAVFVVACWDKPVLGERALTPEPEAGCFTLCDPYAPKLWTHTERRLYAPQEWQAGERCYCDLYAVKPEALPAANECGGGE
jgi:hypothetical protein